jgi:hypothetical protein
MTDAQLGQLAINTIPPTRQQCARHPEHHLV